VAISDVLQPIETVPDRETVAGFGEELKKLLGKKDRSITLELIASDVDFPGGSLKASISDGYKQATGQAADLATALDIARFNLTKEDIVIKEVAAQTPVTPIVKKSAAGLSIKKKE